jgi:isocitrate/isopropylmalate dehydrogenase
MAAVERAMAAGARTRDLGGSASTEDVARAVCNEVGKGVPRPV